MLENLKRWWAAGRRPARREAASRRVRPSIETLEDRAVPALFFVSPFGSDAANGLSPSTPVASIQAAVNRANTGDAVLIAGGTYGYNPFLDQVGTSLGVRSGVVAISGKSIALLGSFDLGFTAENVLATPTTIDAGGAARGIVVFNGGLTMSNLIVEHGVAQPIPPFGGALGVNSYGGGLLAINSPVDVETSAFVQNFAIGQNVSDASGVGRTGGGGGVAIFATPSTPTVMNVAFLLQNFAVGGSGAQTGGFGLGGGAFFNGGQVSGSNDVFGLNLALGGSTGGSGTGTAPEALMGDGFGGGALFEQTVGTSFLNNPTALQNQAMGGSAPNGTGGGGFGGGIGAEGGPQGPGTLAIGGGLIEDNQATGGSGGNGGIAEGGGLNATNASLTVDSVQVLNNSATGGNGGSAAGGPNGGGIRGVSTLGTQNTITISNSTIAGNTAAYGGGGIQNGGSGGGATFTGNLVSITGSDFNGNQLISSTGNLQGQAIALINFINTQAVLNMSNSTIENHVNNFPLTAAALDVFQGSVANLTNVLFSNNSLNTNAPTPNFPTGFPNPAGQINGS